VRALIGAVHVLIGAAIGSVLKKPAAAFVTGIASHAVTDALPHRDLERSVEVPLIAAALGYVGLRHGLRSPEFAGAVGAILPDAEHAAVMAGLIQRKQEVFPTHASAGALHGRESRQIWPQIIISAASLLATELARGGAVSDEDPSRLDARKTAKRIGWESRCAV